MKGMRFLLPAALALASLWWACDSRTVTNSNNGGTGGQVIASVEVALQQTDLFYSQSTRTALRDTVTVLVLDAERAAIAGVTVSCELQSSFGGALIPLTNHQTDENGEARYAFRVLPSDEAFTGDQTVSFVAVAGNRSGTATLTLHEQSDIQLAFLNPADGSIINRMEDPAQTLPVQVFAYRDLTVGDQTQRVGVPGVLINFSVATIGPGIPGVVSAQGTTGSDGVTNNVYYANANAQPRDTVTVRFSAAIVGSTELSAYSTVSLLNDFGYRLTRVLPQNPNMRCDQLCIDSTRFIYQYVDRVGTPVANARFNIEPSFGELTDTAMYSLVTDDAGIIQFTWRSCQLEGGDLVLGLVHTSGRAFNYVFEVQDARPIDLSILTPVPGGELEIDSECLPENATNVRALLKYADNNNPIVGRSILFSANYGEVGSSIATDANGVAAVTWHDCNENDAGQTLTLSAAFMGNSPTPLLQEVQNYPINLPLGTPHHISLSVTLSTLPDPDSGALESMVTATVFNSQNQRLGAGLPLSFRTNGVGQITASSFTNANGEATAVFSLNNQTGVSQITARYSTANDSLDSVPATITVQSGQPVNMVLTTGTPRIQILGFGAASEAQVIGRIVDASGATVTMDVPVRFTLQASPAECYLSQPGHEEQFFRGDTLDVMSQNGQAQMVINAGRRPGVIQIGAFIDTDNLHVYSSSSLVTIVAGPPVHGTLNYDPQGEQVGGSMWRITWSAHFWDRYSNEVRDSTAVYFSVDPADLVAFDGFGMTGFDADDAPDLHGVAKDYMQYTCDVEGAPLDSAWASTAGEILEYDNPFDPTEITGSHPGEVRAAVYGILVPFQPGDIDDNLILEASTDQVIFPSPPCGGGYPANQQVAIRATLRDGYTCFVANQLIQFFCSFGGTFNPTQGYTDVNGQVTTTLTVVPQVLDNTGVPCPEPNPTCTRWNPYNMSVWAVRQPGGPQSDVGIIVMSRPCD